MSELFFTRDVKLSILNRKIVEIKKKIQLSGKHIFLINK